MNTCATYLKHIWVTGHTVMSNYLRDAAWHFKQLSAVICIDNIMFNLEDFVPKTFAFHVYDIMKTDICHGETAAKLPIGDHFLDEVFPQVITN